MPRPSKLQLPWTANKDKRLLEAYSKAIAKYGKPGTLYLEQTPVVRHVSKLLREQLDEFAEYHSLLVPSKVRIRLVEVTKDNYVPPVELPKVVSIPHPKEIPNLTIEDIVRLLDPIKDQLSIMTGKIESLKPAMDKIDFLYRELAGDATKSKEAVVETKPIVIEQPKIEVVAEVIKEELPVDLTDMEIRFRNRFEGKSLGIVGGIYDHRQAERISKRLGVVVNKETWLQLRRNSPSLFLEQHIQLNKIDLLFIFKKSIGHTYSRLARALAHSKNIPVIDDHSLNPVRMAEMFMKLAIRQPPCNK